MLEQNKKIDKSQQRMEHLQRVVETGEATEDTYDEMCDIENCTRERVQGFIERAPEYDRNQEIMFELCERSLAENNSNNVCLDEVNQA